MATKKETTSDALRKMREKSATKSKPKPQSKKQPSPAKPKKQPAKKAATKKPDAEKSNAEFISDSTLLELKADAERLDAEITAQCESLGGEYGKTVAMHAKVEDFIERELWRYCPTPYVSQTAWVQDKNKKLGSAAKLFNIVSGLKELKGVTTQKERAEMGPRKRAVATSAAKKAKSKGKPLPDAIIEGAKNPEVSEKELKKRVADADLGPEPPTPVDDRQTAISGFEPLLAKTGTQTFPYDPKAGGSGVAEGEQANAEQFDSVVNDAIQCASVIYVLPGEKLERDFSVNLKFICRLWLEHECEVAGHEKQTNSEALAEWRKKHQGKSVSA